MDNYLLLKASLLTEGVRADLASLAGLGTVYKEQNHGLFGWDFENHAGLPAPDDFALPDGTVVQFRMNHRSPYHIKTVDGRQVLHYGAEELCEVRWFDRPAFYSRQTTKGHDMVKVGQLGGQDDLFFCYQNYCSHFSRNEQCAFCNLVSTQDVYGQVLKWKDPVEIGEVAAAAWAEGTTKHVNITGGCINQKQEIEIVSRLLGSIREHTGFDTIPGVLLPSPAKGAAIESYHQAGIGALCFAMEVWDEKYYKAICPGKAATTSHGEFVSSIERAVQVFGEGNVWAVFVTGLEPKETFLEGVKTLSGIGANVLPFVWSPNPGSRLSGHRAPFAEWYAETNLEAADIVKDSKVPAGTENHCYLCDGNSMLHDALRLKGIV